MKKTIIMAAALFAAMASTNVVKAPYSKEVSTGTAIIESLSNPGQYTNFPISVRNAMGLNQLIDAINEAAGTNLDIQAIEYQKADGTLVDLFAMYKKYNDSSNWRRAELDYYVGGENTPQFDVKIK